MLTPNKAKEDKTGDILAENESLRQQLAEAQETLRAIQHGEVDALIVSTPEGEQVYSITGSEKPYRILIEEMREGAVMLSKDDTIFYCNKGFANIVKQSLNTLIGKSISGMVNPNHVNSFNELLQLARKSEIAKEKDIAFLASDGTVVPAHVSANSLLKDNFKTTFLVLTNLTEHMQQEVTQYTTDLEREITQRKKAEEALRLSEHRFKSLAENAPDVIMRFDTNLRIMYLNPQVEVATGITAERYLGKTNEEMSMPDDLVKKWNEMFHRAAESKKAQETEFIFPSPNGDRTYDLRVVPEYSEDGSLISFLGISRDITESKKAEFNLEKRTEELENAQKKLEEKATEVEKYASQMEYLAEQRAKQLKDAERLAAIGATAGMVGHDIRNPLQAIASDVYLAKTGLAEIPDSEHKTEVIESLVGIEQNIAYINKIIQDLQDFARPIIAVATNVDIESVCQEILNGIPNNIEVSCQAAKNMNFMADPDLIKRILTNLIVNAIQAMPNGGKIDVRALREGKDTVLTVEDTGVGIPLEVRSKLFTPMVTTKSKGQGFGLAVVKRLTEALGGTVTFESEIDRGSKFILRFPPQKS